MNCFFAGVEQQEQPKLRGKPVIVVPMNSDTTCAIASSYEARKFGIKTGTIVGEAKKLCPQIQIVEARHQLYVQYHNRIVEILNHFFASVLPLSVDEMACPLCPRQKENAKKNTFSLQILVDALKLKMKTDLGSALTCSVGIAPNIFLAKVASDFQKPNGYTLFEGNFTDKLFTYELRDLPGIGKNMEVHLFEHGIFTVKDLWNASHEQLRSVC